MTQKICLITGANAGIGKAAAIQIARAGYYVLIGCRNVNRGIQALKEIKERSYSESIELVEIDLSSKNSIAKAVDQIKERFKNIDVLIHNAADFDISRKEPVTSADGIETIWATNHIGPVLLTNLLLDSVKQSDQGRIITIASQGLLMHPNLKVDLRDPEFKERKFSVSKAYYQSKLAQVMYTYWLANKLVNSKVTCNCIRVTNVKIDLERYPDVSPFMKFLYGIKSSFSISTDEMARTYTYLATSEELNSITGKYFNEKQNRVSSSKYSRDKQNIDDVMSLSFKYLD